MTADSQILATLAVAAVLVVAAYLMMSRAGGGSGAATKSPFIDDEFVKDKFVDWNGGALSFGYPYSYVQAAERAGGGDLEASRLYSTADVDPIITGQLYAGARGGRRDLYGGRVAHGSRWGLNEFSSGVPGQAGVDVGLLGLREYSLDGRPDVFDDGIPENWRLPSTPVNWYAPRGRDHYDVEARGPRVHADNLMSLREPDHDVLTS